MANAPGYFADYLNSLSGTEQTEVFNALTYALARGPALDPPKIIIVSIDQSNGSGRATNNQLYTSTALPKVTMLGNDNIFRYVVDPTDSPINQVDAVSLDATPGGSVWPLVMSRIMDKCAALGVTPPQIAFVPCAKGGSSITEWLPGANHLDRSTLYGSALFRARLAGSGQPGVLTIVERIQGETDAAAGMSQATYAAHLNTLAAAVKADYGCDLIVSKFPFCTSANANGGQAAIWAAIQAGWSLPNIVQGADLSLIRVDSGDGLHLNSDIKISSAADKIIPSIQAQAGLPVGLPPSVNRVPKSEAFDQWLLTRTTVVANNIANPLTGAMTADKVTTDGVAGSKTLVSPVFSVENEAGVSLSAYVKADTAQFIQIYGPSGAFGTAVANFDVVNGLVTQASGMQANIEAVPGAAGWFRIMTLATAISETSDAQIVLNIAATGSSGRGGLGTDNASLYIFGAQAEVRKSPGGYVATA